MGDEVRFDPNWRRMIKVLNQSGEAMRTGQVVIILFLTKKLVNIVAPNLFFSLFIRIYIY